MKKLLIILFLGPFVSFSQVRVPHFPVDSATNRIQYQVTMAFPGVKKEKVFDLMNKWFTDYVQPTKQPFKDVQSDHITLFTGIVTSNNYSKRVGANGGEFNASYATFFDMEIVATDEKAVLTLKNFRANLFGYSINLEDFRDRNFPRIPPVYAEYTTYIYDMYSYFLNDVNQRADGETSNAEKYVAKAKKKGQI